MSELTKEEKIVKILKIVKDQGVTAYELSKNTKLNESGLNRIIKGEITNPHASTINILYNYLCGNITKIETVSSKTLGKFTLKEVGDFVADNFDEVRNESEFFNLVMNKKKREDIKKHLKDRGIKIAYIKKEE